MARGDDTLLTGIAAIVARLNLDLALRNELLAKGERCPQAQHQSNGTFCIRCGLGAALCKTGAS